MLISERIKNLRQAYPSLSSYSPIQPNQPIDLIKPVEQERSTPQQITKTDSVIEGQDVVSRTIQSAALDIPKAFATALRIITEPRKPNEEFRKYFPNISPERTEQLSRPDKLLGIDISFLNKIEDNFKKIVAEPLNRKSLDVIEILNKKQQEIIKPIFDEKPGLSNWKEYTNMIVSGGVSFGEAIGLSLITKNSAIGAGFLSSVESTDAYNRARTEGINHSTALKSAFESGVGTFLLEKIGLDYLFSLGGASRMASALKSTVFETGQEELQTVWQNIVRKKNVDKTQKIFEGWYETAISTSLPSFIAGLFIPGISFKTRQEIVGDMAKESGVSTQQAENAFMEMAGIARKSLEQFEEQAKKFVPGLTIEKVEPDKPLPDTRKSILESDKFVNYSPNIEKKLGVPTKGFDFKKWEISPAMMGTIERGEITDSYLLLKDKFITDKIFSEYLDKLNKLETNRLKKIGASEQEISNVLEKNTEILRSRAKISKETPNTGQILPEKISDKKTEIIGYKKGTEKTIYTYLKNGNDISVIDSDKLAFIKKYLPNAELRMGITPSSPIQIIDKGELKGSLMPIKAEVPEEAIIASKSTLKEIPTLKKLPQEQQPKQQIKNMPDRDVRETIQKTSPLPKDTIEKNINQAKEIQKEIIEKNPPTPQSETADWEGKFELPEETKFQALRRSVEDFNFRLKILNDKIKEVAGEPIKENLDLWAQKDMLPRKQGDLIRRVRDEKREFVEELVKNNILVKDLDENLHATHAIERNAQMNKLRIEKGEEPKDGLSGMTDEKAKEILAKETPEMRNQADKARKIANDTLTFEVEKGLVKSQEAKIYRNTYKYYVPLFRDVENDFTGIGRGVDITGKESKRATGSEKRVVSPLGNIFFRKERAVVRELKNQIGNTIIKATKTYPYLKDIFKIEKQKYLPRFNSEGELQFLDPKFKIGDNIIGTKIEGSQYFITVSDAKIVRALKNLNLARVPKGIRFLRDMLGIWSSFKTRFRPEFLITNFERDLGEALINLGVESGSIQAKGLRRDVVKNLFRSQKRIWKYLRGGRDSIVDEYFKLGGDVGHFWVVDAEKTEKSLIQIEKEIKNAGIEKLKNPVKTAIKVIDNIQSSVELGVRFSAYEQLVKRGMSKEKAIQSVADLTVNFARQGELSPFLKSFYGFINPTIQGSSKVIRSIASKTGRKRIIESVIALTMVGFFTRLASILIDEEGDEQIPDWAKNHRMTFAIGNGKTISIWNMPYGYTSFFSLGNNIAEITMGKKTPEEAIKSVIETSIDSFSPFGTNLSDLIPTLAKPIFEINQNKGWYDNKIYPNQVFTKTPQPDFKTYFDNTNSVSLFVTSMLNKISGGSDTKSGLIDVHPDSLEYAFDQYFGGPFEFAISSMEAGARGIKGEFDVNKTPFVRQFIREGKPSSFSYGVIYDTLERAFKKDISSLEEERFYRAVKIGLKEKVFDKDRANGFIQDFIKAKYQITGSVTNPINKAKINKKMPTEDRIKLLSTYSDRTQKEFEFQESPLDRLKRLRELVK